jgi:hypothetical protein
VKWLTEETAADAVLKGLIAQSFQKSVLETAAGLGNKAFKAFVKQESVSHV